MRSWLRTTIYFAAVILITGFVTAAITINVVNAQREDVVVMSTEEYAKVSDLMALNELINKIGSDYFYDAPSRAELLASAARGMVNSLGDPYSAYYTDEEYQSYLSNINGSYNGIGILIGQPDDTGAAILDVYDNTPAAEVGILAGDIITAVDGASIKGMLLEELSAAVDRDAGQSIVLTILRGEESMDITLTCGSINIRRVEHFLYNQRTGYIRISMFTGNCAEEFKEAIKDLTDRGMKSLVIDLRNNPGGTLSDVVAVADALLGDCTIVSVRGKMDAEGEVYTSNKKGVIVPIAVIVNENSASASEILAAAVQENGAGVVIGMTTYGKGVVQTTERIQADGSWLKLTTDAYYTPTGRNINGSGVTPDIEVDLPEELKGTPIDQLDQEQDAQLWAALDYVREQAGGDAE